MGSHNTYNDTSIEKCDIIGFIIHLSLEEYQPKRQGALRKRVQTTHSGLDARE